MSGQTGWRAEAESPSILRIAFIWNNFAIVSYCFLNLVFKKVCCAPHSTFHCHKKPCVWCVRLTVVTAQSTPVKRMIQTCGVISIKLRFTSYLNEIYGKSSLNRNYPKSLHHPCYESMGPRCCNSAIATLFPQLICSSRVDLSLHKNRPPYIRRMEKCRRAVTQMRAKGLLGFCTTILCHLIVNSANGVAYGTAFFVFHHKISKVQNKWIHPFRAYVCIMAGLTIHTH